MRPDTKALLFWFSHFFLFQTGPRGALLFFGGHIPPSCLLGFRTDRPSSAHCPKTHRVARVWRDDTPRRIAGHLTRKTSHGDQEKRAESGLQHARHVTSTVGLLSTRCRHVKQHRDRSTYMLQAQRREPCYTPGTQRCHSMSGRG